MLRLLSQRKDSAQRAHTQGFLCAYAGMHRPADLALYKPAHNGGCLQLLLPSLIRPGRRAFPTLSRTPATLNPKFMTRTAPSGAAAPNSGGRSGFLFLFQLLLSATVLCGSAARTRLIRQTGLEAAFWQTIRRGEKKGRR